MNRICLRAVGVSHNKYVGIVPPFGILPFRLNVGPDEIFEICNPDGSERKSPLLHGDTVAFKKTGTEGFLDVSGSKLTGSPGLSTSFVVEKTDASSGATVESGDRIGLRSAEGWLSSDIYGMKTTKEHDWNETAFQIYEIPDFSADKPISLTQRGREVDTLPLEPHGHPSGGEVHIHVKLDRPAPPGGIIVSFHFDSQRHAFIPCVLLDGVPEGFAPIYFAHVHEIPVSGFRLNVAATIPCTGETSLNRKAGRIALSIRRRLDFEPFSPEEERRKETRRAQNRRAQNRRLQERRFQHVGQRGFGFDSHFLDIEELVEELAHTF